MCYFGSYVFTITLNSIDDVQVSTVGYFVNAMFYVMFLAGAEDFQVGGYQ